jgi:signal transduction histidine kinase
MKALGAFLAVMHLLSWLVWAIWLPQPYENLGLRLAAATLACVLVFGSVGSHPDTARSRQMFSIVLWLELPLFFSWMFLCNGGNAVWLAGMAAMILAYYCATDWRLATAGLVAGGLAARALFELAEPASPRWSHPLFWTNTMVLAPCVVMGILTGVSCINLRRERLAHTLATMGVMAHELRTPLATMGLVGDAVRGCASDFDNAPARARLDELAMRLHALVRHMNHDIDMQLTNARIDGLPARRETVWAGELVASALANYPFRSTREKECVQVKVHRDFSFSGSHLLFSRVIDNLVKNALRALAAAGQASRCGDITIEVGVQHERGRIVVSDRGAGLSPEAQSRLFEPFFSASGAGHGLGLAFCQQVVHAARGTIRVKSPPDRGAVFTVELPIASRT